MTRVDVRLTAQGKAELEAELAALEAERPVVALRLGEARAGGNDPSENLDLRDAMDALALLEGRIGELRAVLASAEPIEARAFDGTAQLGSTVKIKHADGEVASYMLVSAAEADPRKGRLSVESPIGRALLGKKKKEEITAETPSGPEKLSVLDVS